MKIDLNILRLAEQADQNVGRRTHEELTSMLATLADGSCFRAAMNTNLESPIANLECCMSMTFLAGFELGVKYQQELEKHEALRSKV
jgi:hypothetical protein